MTAPARAGADLRLLRAAVFAAACVTLSAAGHAWASDAAVPVGALAAAWVVVFAVAAPLAGRERSLPGISALMVAGQAGLHLLFSTGQWCAAPVAGGSARTTRVMALAGRLVCGGGGPVRLTPASAYAVVRRAGIDPSAAPGVPAGSHLARVTADMVAMPGMPSMPGMHGGMAYTWQMLAGHLVAGVVAGWLLRRGEAALWRLVRLSADTAGRLARRLPWLAVVAALLAFGSAGAAGTDRGRARRTRRAEDGDGRPESVCLRHSVVRRGPPCWALAA
ncbi:hypothetical protein POF50_019295 [Streptomyces sp. SL13]|uniref:Integral membrane protein n=1 Tax=Streptantibioticus silvisoli TaxID=2705255 RepID=A0AA90H5W5_9ACTN|nr:hypothetical protein [Streptantibioticus silvisoli]MDI5967169.1 hypothetical protein [Streptantibioticus silvisoli]MDI5971455.1 hypothetical protein [Streptantibioticus silvisoli]